jgi:hypothetical protein
MRDLRFESGLESVFHRPSLTGLITQNSTITLWDVPKGAVIHRAIIYQQTADTTTTADLVLESTEGTPRTFVTADVSAATIHNMTATAALLAPFSADATLRLRNTAAGTGDGVYTVLIFGTRPGPEPQ